MPLCNQCGEKLLPEPGLCDQCEDENDEAIEKIDEFIADGHTNHCAYRMVWGDGECECEKKGIVPGRISRMIIAADTEHEEIEED